MNGKVKVDVFGIAKDPKTGGNSLPLKKYFSLVNYLESSDVGSRVDLKFIDPGEPAMSNYPSAQRALKAGMPAPIVFINGVIKYSGNIPYESVYQDIKRILGAKPK